MCQYFEIPNKENIIFFILKKKQMLQQQQKINFKLKYNFLKLL